MCQTEKRNCYESTSNYAQCCAVCDTIAMADTYWFGRTINRKSCIIVSLSPVHLYNFVRNGLTL